jgi:hypothetical protein
MSLLSQPRNIQPYVMDNSALSDPIDCLVLLTLLLCLPPSLSLSLSLSLAVGQTSGLGVEARAESSDVVSTLGPYPHAHTLEARLFPPSERRRSYLPTRCLRKKERGPEETRATEHWCTRRESRAENGDPRPHIHVRRCPSLLFFGLSAGRRLGRPAAGLGGGGEGARRYGQGTPVGGRCGNEWRPNRRGI